MAHQIIPDYRNDQVREDLRDVVAMHKRVMMLVPTGSATRHTAGWRALPDRRGRPRHAHPHPDPDAPDLGRLPAGYGQAGTRELGPLLAWLTPGAIVRYRITANICKRKSHSTKVIALHRN